ncbi:D-alanine--D-alanine ligase [bacterium]|nr:D-alanine--D-alanine ligase [bacterium]
MKTEQQKKKRLVILFGGRSTEHEVSLVSAAGILDNIHREKYEILPVKITRQGKWLLLDAASGAGGGLVEGDSGIPVLPGEPGCGLMRLDNLKAVPVDVVFPVLHGTFGEDGTLQGMLSMAGIPFVGGGVLASALGMDKILMKQMFIQNDLQTVDFIWFLRSRWERESEAILRGIRQEIGYPCFVKPANTGSSVGINKAHDEAGLKKCVEDACAYDRKVIVEKAVDARELECSVLGNDDPRGSVVGEIIPSREFYDYEAKYKDENSRAVIPADIPEDTANRIRYMAVAAFQAVDCAGFARVDFLMDRKSGRLYINEINTIPGFTPISMFPKLWEASGVNYPDLIDRLIELALERHEDLKKSRFLKGK